MNPKFKESILEKIRIDLWQKLMSDEKRIYKKSLKSIDYGILDDKELITDLLGVNSEADFHHPDLLIYFRGEGFSIYIDDTTLSDLEGMEDPNATHIIINSKQRLFCINKRDTAAEKYFLTELTKIFLPTN